MIENPYLLLFHLFFRQRERERGGREARSSSKKRWREEQKQDSSSGSLSSTMTIITRYLLNSFPHFRLFLHVNEEKTKHLEHYVLSVYRIWCSYTHCACMMCKWGLQDSEICECATSLDNEQDPSLALVNNN